MRKIFFILFAVLFIAGQVLAATPGYRMNPGTGDILGQGKYQQDPHKIFRMVRYKPPTWDGSSTLAADSIVIWNLDNTYGDDGITVTTTTTSSDSAVAGIIVTQALTPDADSTTAAEDVGKRNWTWLQTYGKSQVDVLLAAYSGAAMGTSTTAGEANPHQGGEVNYLAQGIAGFFYDDADAEATDVECFLVLD